MKIILDTNFLIYCAKQKIDYKQDIVSLVNDTYELVVPEQVISELINLEKKTKKFSDKTAAGIALKLLKINNVKTIKAKAKNADLSILKESKGNIVATLDLALANKLDKVITIKSKKKLAFR